MNKSHFVLMGALVLFGSLVGGALVTNVLSSNGKYSIQPSTGGLAWVLNTKTGEVTSYRYSNNGLTVHR